MEFKTTFTDPSTGAIFKLSISAILPSNTNFIDSFSSSDISTEDDSSSSSSSLSSSDPSSSSVLITKAPSIAPSASSNFSINPDITFRYIHDISKVKPINRSNNSKAQYVEFGILDNTDIVTKSALDRMCGTGRGTISHRMDDAMAGSPSSSFDVEKEVFYGTERCPIYPIYFVDPISGAVIPQNMVVD